MTSEFDAQMRAEWIERKAARLTADEAVSLLRENGYVKWGNAGWRHGGRGPALSTDVAVRSCLGDNAHLHRASVKWRAESMEA
jgi:hypothetical protein